MDGSRGSIAEVARHLGKTVGADDFSAFGGGVSGLGRAAVLVALAWFLICPLAIAQNYERYRPLNPNAIDPALPLDVPTIPRDDHTEDVTGDDRVLVECLDAVVMVDSADKISTDTAIDSLDGIHYDFSASDSIVFRHGVRSIVQRSIGQPITLRRINQLAADIIKHYRRCKLPIVDVQIPEQRITGGTLHLVIVESRIDRVMIQPGCYFDCAELSRWIDCTHAGSRVYEPHLESDLLWLNQNPFRRVTVDFDKGTDPGTTEVIFKSRDVFPLRGYVGADDTGVETLNYGRFFAGFTYGNLWGLGGTLGYQYTGDEDFSLLAAHSLSYFQPINRAWSFQSYGSWAGVSPAMSDDFTQDGESWQLGASLVRHLVRNRYQQSNVTLGVDFKSTDNNLEFAGSTVSNSTADLLQLHLGYDHLWRGKCIDEYSLLRMDTYIGPGGGTTGTHSSAAFNTIRPGTSPNYVYGRFRWEESAVVKDRWQCVSRFTAQAASERLLFSETLGLGGFDTIRGFDQRAYNADHGWIANVEFGPRSYRWGDENQPSVCRAYSFVDMGNGYVDDPLPGEDAYTFVMTTGVGTRFQVSDRLIARADYGIGVAGGIDQTSSDGRFHFGVTWIPGPRP